MIVRIKLQLKGLNGVIHNLERNTARWEEAVATGLYLVGNNIMTKSKREVPVDTGLLKASGYVTLPQAQGDRVEVQLGYGGNGSRDYAVIQHERMDYRHPNGGKAKFLQDPVDAARGTFSADVAALAKQAFERGGKMPISGFPTDPDQGEATLNGS